MVTSIFYPWNIEIIPDSVIIDATDSTNFTCINHKSDNASLQVNLSKTFLNDEIKLSTKTINQSTIHIELVSNNYIGLFHLFCFNDGELSKGTRADVITKATTGVLQLAEKCRVYDKKYIKCRILASNIARAIRNGYPPRFNFKELSYSPERTAYTLQPEFLKDESTNEYLTFKWKPMVDGEFPDRVRMQMNTMLPHFDQASYIFDMTPVFRITPKFTLQATSSTEIQLNITSIHPAAFCEKMIIPKLNKTLRQTWVIMESDQTSFIFERLASNSIYRICVKCRQSFYDPDGMEECQEIKTLSFFSFMSSKNFFIFIIIILMLLLLLSIIIGLRQRRNSYIKVRNKEKDADRSAATNIYESRTGSQQGSNLPSDTDSRISGHMSYEIEVYTDDSSVEKHGGGYLPIASMSDVIEQCSAPTILSSPENVRFC